VKKFNNIFTKNAICHVFILTVVFSTFGHPYSWAITSAENNTLRIPLQLSVAEYKKRVLDLLEIAISAGQEAVIPFDVGDIPKSADLVILDYDGLLVDSIKYAPAWYGKLYYKVTKGIQDDVELRLSPQELEEGMMFLEAHGNLSFPEAVRAMKGIAVSSGVTAGLLKTEEEYIKEYFDWRIETAKKQISTDKAKWLMPGAEMLLMSLRESGKKVCVLSNTFKYAIERELELLGIRNYIDRIFDTSEPFRGISTGNRKADEIGNIMKIYGITDKSRVYIVGDSKSDVDGGNEAGIRSVGIANNDIQAGRRLVAAEPAFLATSLKPLIGFFSRSARNNN